MNRFIFDTLIVNKHYHLDVKFISHDKALFNNAILSVIYVIINFNMD